MGSRAARSWFIVLAVLVFAPNSAIAAQRWASPTGSSAAPCSAISPCDIVTAINGTGGNPVHSGDEVIVETGYYGSPTPLSTTLQPPVTETIHGQAGQPIPRIFSEPSGIDVLSSSVPSVAVSYLDLETSTKSAFYVGSGTVDRVIAHTSRQQGAACTESPGVVTTNSVCWSSGFNGSGFYENVGCGAAFTTTLRNVDAYATGAASNGIYFSTNGSGCHGTLAATNVIARGTSADISARGIAPATSNVTLDHSDYVSVKTTGAATITPAGAGTNLTADPALAAPSFGDFHETALSPTIDRGITASANGSLDLDAQQRTAAGRTDIGADEYFAPPALTPAAPTGVSPHGATLNGSVNPGHQKTLYTFVYGTTPALGHGTPAKSVGPVPASQHVSAALTGLPPLTVVYWKLVASNPSGTRATQVRHFRTADAFPGVLINKKTVKVKHGKARVKLACPAGTPPPCTGTLTLRYRRTTKDSKGHKHTKKLKLGAATFKLQPGHRRKVAVALSPKALQLISSLGSLKVNAIATAKDGAGTKKTTTAKVRLKPA